MFIVFWSFFILLIFLSTGNSLKNEFVDPNGWWPIIWKTLLRDQIQKKALFQI